MKTIFDVNQSGVTTFEEGEKEFTLTKTQDTQPIVEQNKKEYNSGVNDGGKTALGRKVASIPLVVWQNWMKATNGEIQHNPKLLAHYLNDPDNKYFRTHNSRI